jgi:hypothetical protein
MPLKKMLDIMERVRLSFPKMSKIWSYSTVAQGDELGHRRIEQILELEKDTLRGLEQGKLNLHDPVTLNMGTKGGNKDKKGGRKRNA